MGQKVSRVYGTIIKRPMQRYNVEHRAHKVLDKIENPAAPAMRAPMYQSDKQILDQVRQENPELGAEMKRKDETLHAHLKDVYVTSKDPPGMAPAEQSTRQVHLDRPLPLDRTVNSEVFIPGLLRVDKRKAPRGKITLEQAMTLLTDHASKPEVHTVQSLATTYRLNPETLEDVVKHFKLFKVHIPTEKEEEEYDPLKAGKTWVSDVKEELQDSYDMHQERMQHLKRLKQKDKERKERDKLQQLESGK
jgi:NADH dehydrogenase [ubiquinone] 1 alpha subcomplex assembly factor 4